MSDRTTNVARGHDLADGTPATHSRLGESESCGNRIELLSNRRCRYALSCLQAADDGVATLRELIDWVARREGTQENEQYESIAVALHQAYLPNLAANGILDYDMRSRTVRYHGHPDVEQLVTHHGSTGGDEL
ncbi:DUF7344 domain-containing protein [Haloarcula nitratireducens]|uniref:DUF7344 domain-containing protein n=1 Tax=Haloarcula nitratireducens TaxID=2487749 RepID=A0AAW4PFX3_9EURY|nr:hypothetical protein [Halomicroarcula nitratireducens]MBX0296768.1 hypothetical protein [Halomicroarcula nitratireducens]